jgi:hypothetical protein
MLSLRSYTIMGMSYMIHRFLGYGIHPVLNRLFFRAWKPYVYLTKPVYAGFVQTYIVICRVSSFAIMPALGSRIL